jgi:molecular chaperone GrpE
MLRSPKKKNPDAEHAVHSPAAAADPSCTSPEASPAEPVAPVCEPAPEVPVAAPPEAGNSVLERELAASKDRYLRLMADFENARKRLSREREETIRRANEELLNALLPVLDHLELALSSPSLERETPFVKGVQMVADQFVAVLQKFDLKPVAALGTTFDPGQHEALTQMASATVPAGHVLQQLRRGWNLSGKLLRPAQVIVSSGAPDAEVGQAEPAP